MASANDRGIAIGLVVAAMLLFAVLDATSRSLGGRYEPLQVIWVRNLMFGCAMVIARPQVFSGLTRVQAPGLQLVRSLVLLLEAVVFVVAFAANPLADVHALAAVSPLLTMSLAAVVLRESMPRHGVAIVAVAACGAVVLVDPTAALWRWQVVLPLLGAALWSLYQVLTRCALARDDVDTTTVITPLLGAVLLAPAMPWLWRMPDGRDWALLGLGGLAGTAAHWLLVAALRRAGAAAIQPFTFTVFVWAVLVGWAAYGDVPTTRVWVGAAIVLGAGVYGLRASAAAHPT